MLSEPFIESLVSLESFQFGGSGMEGGPEKQFVDDFLPKLTSWGKIKTGLTDMENLTTLYTQETYQEFHRLLVNLLVEFSSAVKSLANLDKALLEKPKDATTLSKFRDAVQAAVTTGYGLHLLSKSKALEKHLESIEAHLHQQLASSVVMDQLQSPPDVVKESPMELDNCSAIDEDMLDLQEDAKKALLVR